MKIVNEFPPNYQLIREVFRNCDEFKPIFSYGDIIYNPYNINVTPDLEVHEEVHMKQQGEDVEGWWNRYLIDKDFRLKQEIEAYGTQFHWVKSKIQNRILVEWSKEKMAQALSGDMYGNLLSYGEAESKIRNYAKSLNK